MTSSDSKSNKLQQFAENRRESVIVNVTNASTFWVILKWLFANKVSVILFILLSISAASYYSLQLQYLEDTNKRLILERDEILDRTTELERKIHDLEKDKAIASGLNEEVKGKAKSLTSDQKRRKILQQIRSLKIKRGLKP
jgi:hypothetical protein